MKVSDVAPFSGIEAAPKALIITGGKGIVIGAVTVCWSTVASALPAPPEVAVNVAVAVPAA